MKKLDARKLLQVEQKLTLSIESLNASGQGVARYAGITVFVSGALPQERVEVKLVQVKKTYAVADCLNVIFASPMRVIPDCPHYGLCGSCQLKHLSYDYSLEFKWQKVVDALCSITKLERVVAENLVKPTLASPQTEHYRNKLVYNFARCQSASGWKASYSCQTGAGLKIVTNNQILSCQQACSLSHTDVNSQVHTNYQGFSGLKAVADVKAAVDMQANADSQVVKSQINVVPQIADKQTEKHDFKLGFFAPKSHDVVELLECPAEFTDAYKIRQTVKAASRQIYLQEKATKLGLGELFYNEVDNTGLFKRLMLRYSNYAKQTLLTFVVNLSEADYTQEVAQFFADLALDLSKELSLAGCFVNLQSEATNKIYSDKFRLVYGQASVKECLQVVGRNFIYEIGAADFFQVNPSCAEVLFSTALKLLNLSGQERVYDLYCGTGSISLPLASQAKEVIGIEIVESAIKHARSNQALNQIENAEFFAADTGLLFPKLFAQGRVADCVVVDPPRKGLDATTIETILEMQPKKLLYVSCEPGSLARDLGLLLASGKYKLKAVQPVDMFPGSSHVECVVLMSRAD